VKPPRIGVIGCGTGGFVIAMARASPAAVLAGFDSDPQAVASARHAAARAGVADRVTFEVAASGDLLGASYDVIYLLPGRSVIAGPSGMGHRSRAWVRASLTRNINCQ